MEPRSVAALDRQPTAAEALDVEAVAAAQDEQIAGRPHRAGGKRGAVMHPVRLAPQEAIDVVLGLHE